MKNGLVVDEYGHKRWYLNGKRHREDGPAVEWANGFKQWYINDKRHREDGPAFEYVNGDKEWWYNGMLHREDGPAVEYANGDKQWWYKGERFCTDSLEDYLRLVTLIKHYNIEEL